MASLSNLRHIIVIATLWCVHLISFYSRARTATYSNIWLEWLIQCFNQVSLLLFNIFLICITNEVNIFSLSFSSTLFIFNWMEWVFFIKFIKSTTVVLRTEFWEEWGFSVTNIFPIKTIKEWMIFNFINTIQTKSMFTIT